MTDPVDLTNCDREPIHIPGSIQPHGAMLVCDPSSYRVQFASENLARTIGHDRDPLGAELSAIIGPEAAHDVRNAAAQAGGSQIAGIVLAARLPRTEDLFDLIVHQHEGRTFVEIEPSDRSGKSAEDALETTQKLIRRIGRESDVQSIVRSAARLVRGMLGYDRVMVYQFLHNGAGRVIAEAKRPSLGSFLGQHFPASDIPVQARSLYLANTIRMIADASYAPVRLVPPLGADETPVDMTFAQMRSVSPIHCEYLANMGVHASLSISIVVEGELWGLIACHHAVPKVTPLPLRIGAELFGQYCSLQIALAERREEVTAAKLASERLDQIVSRLNSEAPLAENLRSHLPDLAALIDCDGAALWSAGEWTAVGAAPPPAAAPVLIEKLRAQGAADAIWWTQNLQGLLGSEHYGRSVAGVLAAPLSSTSRDYLLFFRSEEAHELEWAGEPIKISLSTPQGERLSPRGSFELWREEVRGLARPWTRAEQAVAEAIRTYLRDVVLRHSERSAEEHSRLEHRRRILNDELNHRVKNIIALVKSIAQQTGAHAQSVADYTVSLEGRLRALAFAHDQSLAGQNSGDLATLIEAEAGLYRYRGAPERVVLSGRPVRLEDRAFGAAALVIHELMTNAAKYGALSLPTGCVEISWGIAENGGCEIDWVEVGGPKVEPPQRTGFGSRLIQSTLAYDLGGGAEIKYLPGGVQARLTIPARHVALVAAGAPAQPRSEARRTSLEGLDVLLVEDQSLIAMDLEDTLRQLGAREVRAFPSVAEAIHCLAEFTPHIAVLDFNLGTETSEAVAERLEARQAPFIFATGYGDSVMLPSRFAYAPVIRKPVSATALAAKIAEALGAALPRPRP